MKTAVITIVSGRHDHLQRQQRGLGQSTMLPDAYYVVAMNDPELERWKPSSGPEPHVISVSTLRRGLPLAAARNAGAARAIADGAELLVFLDVDCIPAAHMLEQYCDAVRHQPRALLMGAVGYLSEDTDYDDDERFAASAYFHDFRQRLSAGETGVADARIFWSLSFALTPLAWSMIGGFCEDYTGYGGEDTDFAQLARRAGIQPMWVGGAEAFHQFHPTSNPPVEHLDDILVNARLFEKRWDFWPMQGWLDDFERLGLVEWDVASRAWRRTAVAA